MVPWDDLRLSQVEAAAAGCPDACAVDVVSLVAEVRRLREQLRIAESRTRRGGSGAGAGAGR